MKYSKCREINNIVKILVRQGWLFQQGGKHGQIRPPSCGGTLTVPKTPSDWRSFKNFRRDLRRFSIGLSEKGEPGR